MSNKPSTQPGKTQQDGKHKSMPETQPRSKGKTDNPDIDHERPVGRSRDQEERGSAGSRQQDGQARRG